MRYLNTLYGLNINLKDTECQILLENIYFSETSQGRETVIKIPQS